MHPSSLRAELVVRLAGELGDAALAEAAVDGLDTGIVTRLVELAGDVSATPLLSYRPETMPDAEVESLWVLAFGYRLRNGGAGSDVGGEVPAMDDLAPGPTNEALARAAAAFVEHTPVPIVAQWEVARILDLLGVGGVVSVEPDQGDDGSVDYLSTAGVLRKGLVQAADAGLTVGRAGILAHADHANRCLMTAAAAGMAAAVPGSVALPRSYDDESGQVWTRSRASFVAVDLMARAFIA